jgi:hypothetical protein
VPLTESVAGCECVRAKTTDPSTLELAESFAGETLQDVRLYLIAVVKAGAVGSADKADCDLGGRGPVHLVVPAAVAWA